MSDLKRTHCNQTYSQFDMVDREQFSLSVGISLPVGQSMDHREQFSLSVGISLPVGQSMVHRGMFGKILQFSLSVGISPPPGQSRIQWSTVGCSVIIYSFPYL